MVWVLVLGLLAWAFMLSVQLAGLRQRADALERRLLDLKDRLDHGAAARPEPKAEPVRAPPREAPEPLAPAPVAAPARATLTQRIAAPRSPSEPAAGEAPFQPSPGRSAGPPVRDQVRAWLEENGLAWAGGAALALGGLFLVAYAAQRGFFTPAMRIGAAVLTGLILVGASEWLRRRLDYALAAALAAGAGAATLYGAAWASYWLYSFIGLPAAGGLLAAISLGLLGLGFRHGEPLAVLAVVGGFLAPAITGPDHWTAPALTAFLGLMTVTGFAVAGARRWGLAGVATVACAFLWAIAGFAAEGYDRVTALGLAPLALAYAAVEWRRRRGEPAPVTEPPSAFTLMPLMALIAATMAVSALGFAGSFFGGGLNPVILVSAGVGAAVLALLAGYGARRGLVDPLLHAIGYLPGFAIVVLVLRAYVPTPAYQAWGVIVALAVAGGGVLAASAGQDRRPRLAAAVAVLPILALSLAFDHRLPGLPPWVATAAAAVILLAAAVAVAWRTTDKETDAGMAVWFWAAGAAAIYALWRGVQPGFMPLAGAGLSLVAALAHARLGWRGFAGVMIAGALASLSALMAPALFRQLTDGSFPWWALALVAAASVALSYAGAWLSRSAGRPAEGVDAQSTAAVLVAIAGVGVLLRVAATAGVPGGGGLDRFLEASLRDITILAGGLTTAQAVRASSSAIGRWRGQVLLGLGLAHALIFQILLLNPIFATWRPPVAGPPLLDSLALGFLAPAVLLGVATWKKVALNRGLLRLYAAGAALLGVLWMLEEIRRLFQGASLHGGLEGVGRAEAAAYAVAVLLIARALAWAGERAATRDWTVSPIAADIARLARFGAWGALAFALLVFAYGASPWWGPIDRPLAGVNATGLLFALYAAGGAAAFALVGPALQAGDAWLARAARMSVVVIVFALINLVVRLAFNGFDMRPTLTPNNLETWAFSAVWGLYGFGLIVYGAGRRNADLRLAGLVALGATLAKIFLFDMARLDGVIRAASFLAVGALLLGAAVMVRRLTKAGGFSFGAKPPSG